MDKNGNTSNNSGQSQAEGQNPQAQAANSASQVDNETPNNTNLSFDDLQRLYADSQRQLSETKREAQNLRKRFRDQETEAAQAEQQRLAEQGQYKQLAEKHEARVKELEPLAEAYGRLAEQLHQQIDAEIAQWPDEFKALVSDNKARLDERMASVERVRKALATIQQQARGTLPGNGPNPKPSQQTPEGARTQFEQHMRASGKYSG